MIKFYLTVAFLISLVLGALYYRNTVEKKIVNEVIIDTQVEQEKVRKKVNEAIGRSDGNVDSATERLRARQVERANKKP